MESAAIAANGFRFRVPYGTLLCVSDKALHGEIKLAGMAGEFYRPLSAHVCPPNVPNARVCRRKRHAQTEKRELRA